jgi:hypothetical protein
MNKTYLEVKMNKTKLDEDEYLLDSNDLFDIDLSSEDEDDEDAAYLRESQSGLIKSEDEDSDDSLMEEYSEDDEEDEY